MFQIRNQSSAADVPEANNIATLPPLEAPPAGHMSGDGPGCKCDPPDNDRPNRTHMAGMGESAALLSQLSYLPNQALEQHA
jgi:hypothetical protein